jgi:hypothetical protein
MFNAQGKTIKKVWDDSQLKLTFRRNFSLSLMQKWYEIEEISSSITYTSDSDVLIWQFENKGENSTLSFYSIINYGGVTPIFIPATWHLHVPPRLHIFLWLLTHNKLMTRDNLGKKLE